MWELATRQLPFEGGRAGAFGGRCGSGARAELLLRCGPRLHSCASHCARPATTLQAGTVRRAALRWGRLGGPPAAACCGLCRCRTWRTAARAALPALRLTLSAPLRPCWCRSLPDHLARADACGDAWRRQWAGGTRGARAAGRGADLLPGLCGPDGGVLGGGPRQAAHVPGYCAGGCWGGEGGSGSERRVVCPPAAATTLHNPTANRRPHALP